MLWLVLPVAVVLALFGIAAYRVNRRAAVALERTVAEERELTASLEQAVASRTSELENAQRVLQRMWWLGQQITLELNPQRVLDRFLEAVVDIAQADGAVIGLLGDDGKVRVVIGTGIGAPLSGAAVPINESVMGRVLRSGVAWTSADLQANADELNPELYARVKGNIGS